LPLSRFAIVMPMPDAADDAIERCCAAAEMLLMFRYFTPPRCYVCAFARYFVTLFRCHATRA